MPSDGTLGSPGKGVTVVVPTRDRSARLAGCLQSIGLALHDHDELVVVDSASVDAEAVARVALANGARLIRCERPGVDIARNAGWRAAEHAIVLFTDDDVEVDLGWRDALAGAIAADDTLGFVTGRVLPPKGSDPSRDVAIKRDLEPERYDESSVGNLGHGASLAVPRVVLERLGGWDEALGVGGRFGAAPEQDLFDRCFGLGLSGRYEPSALAFHEQWRGPRRLILLDLRYGYGIGARLSKLFRSDRHRAVLVGRDAVRWSGSEVVRELQARHFYPAIGHLVRLVAIPFGLLRGWLVPVVDGHFRTR
jgi:GT2 family glycosyltransferase